MRGIQMMRKRALENLVAYKARQPLAGHLMPYMLEDEAHQQGLHFGEEHGWLEEDEKVVLPKANRRLESFSG